MGASSANADVTFNAMKQTINSIIGAYGTNRIRYSVITFSTSTVKQLDFLDNSNSIDVLKRSIQSMRRRPGDLNLAKALGEAKKLFDSDGARPNARKVVVVIMDKKSASLESDTRSAAQPLEDAGIRVIPVALGREADSREARLMTPNKANVIAAEPSEDSKDIAKKIMVKVLKGASIYVFIHTHSQTKRREKRNKKTCIFDFKNANGKFIILS